MPRSRSHCRRPKLAPRGLVRGPTLRSGLLLPCPMPRRRHSRSRALLRTVLGGDGVQDRPELKGFLMPQKRSHVGLLADRHWRTACANSSPRGFQWVDTMRTWTVDRVIAEFLMGDSHCFFLVAPESKFRKGRCSPPAP
jgi:hypothetical protein